MRELAIIVLCALLLASGLWHWYQNGDIKARKTANYFLLNQRDECRKRKEVLLEKIQLYKIDSTYGNIQQQCQGTD